MALKKMVRKALLIGLPILLIFAILGGLVFLLNNPFDRYGPLDSGVLLVFLYGGCVFFFIFCMLIAWMANGNQGRRDWHDNYDDSWYREENEPSAGRQGGSWYWWWW